MIDTLGADHEAPRGYAIAPSRWSIVFAPGEEDLLPIVTRTVHTRASGVETNFRIPLRVTCMYEHIWKFIITEHGKRCWYNI